MIVDAHMHIWDKIDGKIGVDTVVKPLDGGRVTIGGAEVLMMPPSYFDCRSTAEQAVAHFDDAGVDVGVVVQEYMDGIQNDYLVEVMKKYPDRFFAYALLDMWKPKTCLKAWEGVKKQGFRGVKVPGGHLYNGKPRVMLDDPGLMAVYEAMAAEGWNLSVDPAEGALQVAELENIAKTFPTLQIALGHFAMVNRPNWFPQLRLAKRENVSIESGGICWLFRDDGVLFDDAQEAIRVAVNEVGIESLMWGSDLPRTMVDFTYRQLLDWARDGLDFLSEDEKDGFLGLNAARIYRLDTSRGGRAPQRVITE